MSPSDLWLRDELDNLGDAALPGDVEGCGATPVARRRVGAERQQLPDLGDVTEDDSEHQRRGSPAMVA
eukprot:CAMPEP_0176177138 /NCGR_PEP_ID=MMETSP0120_2-20121206/90749_1 /TAXON_ID=160619 /ORGANISM="Kryptoperidinium foliaceum, Strain CCMP 1326" /LENGTH=67 /DNA_ID=CAMNT_0017515231 /DNA_START=165 /DNA_END=368 /DNA_ORIENTATION=+